jgi:hypothetical protein
VHLLLSHYISAVVLQCQAISSATKHQFLESMMFLCNSCPSMLLPSAGQLIWLLSFLYRLLLMQFFCSVLHRLRIVDASEMHIRS